MDDGNENEHSFVPKRNYLGTFCLNVSLKNWCRFYAGCFEILKKLKFRGNTLHERPLGLMITSSPFPKHFLAVDGDFELMGCGDIFSLPVVS